MIESNRIGCRTKHGVATMRWGCIGQKTSPLWARNALLPDGTRGDVQGRTTGWWRRRGRGDKRWIIGDVDIRATDVVFVDRASQDLRYEPPGGESDAQLERDLALHRPFVEALADDKFAAVAHQMLAHLDWMRIGAREIGLLEGLHDMFACLRNKGEDYLDFKFGEYPGGAPTKAEAAKHVLRMKEIMRSLGWRTYTADELQARLREDFRARLERRLEAWRRLDAYEARSAGSHDVLAKTPLISDMLLYEGDDPEWLAELRGEERLAASAQFIERLKDLANSGRLTAGEYEDLLQALL
ncbi:hypothetical protein [Bradyrhizobium sp. AZCC 2230]|uniref:hypothetical protein n=1 Tax=Bradyrhizobium sp. AZCC 2230 TaxID=3117021 RepID=UPI002FEEF088